MATPQVTQQDQQTDQEQRPDQVTQADLTQALQPVMTQVEQQIEQIIKQQMNEALQPLRQNMGQILGQAQTGQPQQAGNDSSNGQSPQAGQATATDSAAGMTQDQAQGQPQDQAQGQAQDQEQSKGDESPLVSILQQQINDAMGHDVGDRILQAVVGRLNMLVPDGGLLARWGGDEFVLVLGHDDGGFPEAERIANALIEAVNQPFEIQGQSVSLGLSAGLAMYPGDATTHEALILAADLAVAEVKRQGRGKVLSFCESYAATQKRRFDVSRALAEAIEVEQLVLHYQPIFNGRTGNIHGYEALARWNHPVLGWVGPDEFIPIAEESDGIIALGDLVLRGACADAAGWTTPDHAPIVAVNVSVKQLREADFALRVAQILARTGLPAGRLELEVTESVFAEDHIDATRCSIESLRAIGVSLSIDDFGTGYSSLSRLLSLPVTAVKIDRSFVSALDGNGGAVIESTLLIARRLGISVVAEGVETQEQFARLSAMGVDLFQGYYFGKPAPAVVNRHDIKLLVGMGAG